MKELAKFTVCVHESEIKTLNKYGSIDEVLEGIYILPDRAQYDVNTGLSLENHWMEETLLP